MIKLKDGYAKLIGTTATGSANNVLLSNGGDKITGNASGNIPLNNGTLNVDLNADKLDGYDSNDFFRHEGHWSSTDDTKNVNSATGMLFVYKKHGVPELYGTIATFRGKPQPNYYNLQLYGSALNKLFFRNWSPDLGLKDWVEVLSTGNYTKYLGYIGTTAVQATSAVQDLTGIGNIEIASYNNDDKYITFNTKGTRCWRLGYTGSGNGDANYLTFQSTKTATAADGWSNALTLGCETLKATFSGNILVDKAVPIIQAKGTNGSVSLLVDSQRGLYDHVTSKWALGITAANNTYLNVGNVGIGTASPSEKLHVAGKVLATHFVKSGATNALILLGNGSNTGAGVKGNLLYYTAGVPGWTATRYFFLNLDDNAGKPVYVLISDVTAQQNATSSAPVGNYGIVGTFYGYRNGNMSGTNVIDVTAYATYSKNNVRLKASICPESGGAIIPYIVKYLEKYYIALKKKGSGRTHYFYGLAFNLLDSFISVPCTDAQGTCPDIEIIREPDEYYPITSTKISDYTNTYDILHSGNFKNVIGNGSYWKVNDKTYNVTSNGSTSSEDIYLEMWRGTNSSWKMINSGGHLKFQNNYTTTVGNYFDVLSLAYSSGSATLKGNLNIKGEGLYLSSSGTYPRLRIVNAYNDLYIQASKGDGSALEGYLNITGMNNTSLKSLTLKSDQTVIPGRVIIKNANAHDALDVFTTYNAYTYLRLGRDYEKNNCSEFLYEYAGLNSTNNNLRIGFYNNSTSLLRGYAGGNWKLNNNLSINKEFNANDKHFNYALAYKEIHGFDVPGMVVITLPNSWNDGMNLYEIDIYDYAGGTKVDDALHSKLTIGVYNYTETHYYNYGYTQLGSFNRKVRLAHDGTHCCILLGEPTSTWNFTLIFLSRVLSGRSAHRTWSSGYEINLVTSETAYTKITELHRTRLRFDDVVADDFRGNLIGNADTASSAAKWTTARTLTVGNSAKTVDGSADVTWDLKSILLNPTTITTATSWDITTPGVYKVSSGSDFTGTNNPESANGGGTPYRYGLLIVSSFGANCGLAQFYISHYDSGDSRYGIKYRTGYNTTYLTKWARILDSTNYNKYAPTLTGTGASGTWNINITGNAATATNATNSDKLDGWHRYQVLSITNRSLLEICDTLPLLEYEVPIGENTSVVKAIDNTAPHAKVWYCTGFVSITVPGTLYFTPGETICVESWIMRPSGATGTAGTYYFGINFRDKNGKPVNSNNGCHYFGQSSNWTCPCDGVWYRRYNEFTIPTSHTAYNGSDGEGYFSGTIRGYLNYNQGTIPTYYGGFRIYKKNLNVSVPSADAATKVWVSLHNSNDINYPLIWSNSPDTANRQSNQLYKSYDDLIYNPKYKRLTVKGLITSPQFYHSLTSTSSTPIFYVKADNNDSTLLRVDFSGKSTFLGDYGYSLKYLGSDSNNRLALMADNSTATTLNVAIAFTNAGNVGIRDYAKTDCALYVKGNSRFGGDSRIDGNLLVGNNATRNYIAFYGTTGDGPGSFNYTYIGENATGTNELSELILFKGNDPYNNGAGPDRIRHIAALHLFLIYKSSALSGTFEAICTSTTPVNVFAINANDITSYLSVLPSANNTYNLGSSSLKWSNVYSVLGNFSGLITSSVANGTAPFVITSKTVVGNLNSDLFDGFHETSFFRSCRGNISTDYVDIDVFSNGDSRFKVVDPGTYSINRSTHSELFINFKGDGSTSGLEFKTNYDNNARLCIRKTVDSKRISGVWKELAFYDDIKTKLDGYYWANVKISSTSSKYTLPTFLNLFIDTYDATLKIYSGRIADAKSDGNICFLTCFDNLDGQSHSYASSTYASRLNLVLLPRAGQVYIGINPDGGNTNYKLYVNGAIYGTRFAGPADKLTTARTIALGEAVKSTATAFDGSANISIPVTELKESYLVWGGKNIAGGFGPLDAAMVGMFGANRFDLMDPSKIVVEYSRDGGSTWLDYGADNINKINLVSQTVTNSPFISGKSNTTDRPTANCRLRVIINTASSVYTRLKKFYIYLTTEYANACKCTVSGRLQLDYENNANNWTVFVDNASVTGWSGWNVLNVDFTTYGNNKATLYGQIKFEFSCGSISSSISSSAKGLTIYKIFGVGGVGWTTPSFMSQYNHLYKYNAEKKATFPGIVEATGFLKTGSSDSYVLLGGGGHKTISSFLTTYDSRYVLKSGDTMTGKLEISGAVYPLLTLTRSNSTNGALIGFKNNNGTLGYIGMKHEVNSGLYRYTDDTVGIYKVWDEGNDGPGSGLNADLLDGTHKSDLLSSITSTHTTNLSVTVGGTNKDVTKLWSSMLSIKDIRGTNVNPSDSSIQSNAITAWFNNTGTPTTDWYSGFSVKGWGNNYGVWLLCSYSSDSGTPTGSLYFRQGEDSTWKNWRTILDDSNTSVSGGGSNWGDSITVSINGISTTLTIPNLPADVNVTLTNTTTSANYRVLLSKNANDTTETASSRKSAKLYFNPSTGVLTTTKVSANLDGDIVKKTPLLCEATESDNINIVENANGAITNNYISNLSAIRKAIQFRWYSTYWQIGNVRGASSGTDGFGVTYGSNTLCFRVTETASYVYGNMYAVHFYESSDKRLKTNIQEILNSDKMPIIKEFDWKEDGSHSYGLIAQELEEQGYSELVSVKDDGYKTVNYSAALSLIVGKLQVKIKELEKEIENLKNKN